MKSTSFHKLSTYDSTRIDCALFDEDFGIIGQSWHVDAEAIGTLSEDGFIYDFSRLKKLIKRVCDETIDHTLVIPRDHCSVSVVKEQRGRLNVELKSTDGASYRYRADEDAVSIVESDKINKSELELFLSKKIHGLLPENVVEFRLKLREEKTEDIFFRYTHGLFNYDGLCQRLFHGHRGRIRVEIDGENSKEWATFAKEQILGSKSHIACNAQITNTSSNGYISLKSSEGSFCYSAELPQHKVLLLEEETSIEKIAAYLAQEICSRANAKNTVAVEVFEGINKSATSIKKL